TVPARAVLLEVCWLEFPWSLVFGVWSFPSPSSSLNKSLADGVNRASSGKWRRSLPLRSISSKSLTLMICFIVQGTIKNLIHQRGVDRIHRRRLLERRSRLTPLHKPNRL